MFFRKGVRGKPLFIYKAKNKNRVNYYICIANPCISGYFFIKYINNKYIIICYRIFFLLFFRFLSSFFSFETFCTVNLSPYAENPRAEKPYVGKPHAGNLIVEGFLRNLG